MKLQQKPTMATRVFLKCGLINIQSVRNKTHEIRELIVDESFDILCFRSVAPRIYNKLSSVIRTINNIGTFKKKLKTHLFMEIYDLQDSSINETYEV